MVASKQTWASSLFTAVVAVIVGIAVLLQQSAPTSATRDWETGLVVLGAALIVVILGLVGGIVRERPRLIIDNPVVDPIRLDVGAFPAGWSSTAVATSTTTSASVAAVPGSSAGLKAVYLHIRNEPRAGATPAHAVQVRLRFWRDTETLYELPARWSHTDQRVPYESTQVPHQEDLPANGVDYKLDIACKFPGENQCHALTDRVRYTSWQSYPLGTEPVMVDVLARGVNARSRSTWVLTHEGTDGGLTLTRSATRRLPRLAGHSHRRRWSRKNKP